MVRKTDVPTMIMQSFTICCLSTVLWIIGGYSITFTDGGSLNAITGGLDKIFLAGIGPDAMAGAFANRMKVSAMLLFTGAWVPLVYSPLVHWVWGGRFLAEEGVLVFSGGTVVYINADVAGLVAAIMLGKRRG
jgi:Amt family ammonium transporter